MRLIKVFLPIRAILVSFVALLLVLTTVACASNEQKNSDRPLIVATIFPSFDFARNVAGEHADVELLVDVTDSHSYSPTAADMLLIEECDIFIYTGGEGDLWAEDFLSNIDTTDKKIINMIDSVDFLLEATDATHHEHEHDHDLEHGDKIVYDEHVWLAPVNAISITASICDALVEVDGDHADAYRSGADGYIEQLTALDADFTELVESADSRTILVADRFPFRYLCEEYGLSYYAALPGCSSAADLTAVEYEHLAEQLREKDLSVIFTAEYSDGTIARTVQRECGREDVSILTLHSCHTMTRGQIDKGNSYLSLMRENIEALKQALN